MSKVKHASSLEPRAAFQCLVCLHGRTMQTAHVEGVQRGLKSTAAREHLLSCMAEIALTAFSSSCYGKPTPKQQVLLVTACDRPLFMNQHGLCRALPAHITFVCVFGDKDPNKFYLYSMLWISK